MEHVVTEVWGWLVANNLIKDLIAIGAGALVAWMLRLGKRLKRIEEHLNTNKPGGLTDVVNAIKEDRTEL